MAFPAQINDLICSFNNLCLSTLDVVALLKNKSICTVNSSPWINDDVLKEKCRAYMEKYDVKELLSSFNKKVKEVRTVYFSNLIDCDKKIPDLCSALLNCFLTS